jgi:hypothetical protein
MMLQDSLSQRDVDDVALVCRFLASRTTQAVALWNAMLYRKLHDTVPMVAAIPILYFGWQKIGFATR